MKLSDTLLQAVNRATSEKTAVAFSGGIDSTLLAIACKKLGKDFTLYTIGLQGSPDMEWATKIAIKMNWPLKLKLVTNQEAFETIRFIVNLLKTDDPVHVGVGCMTYSVLQLAKEHKSQEILSGLGADEAFAGYGSHKKALEKNEVHEECLRRIEGVTVDVERDTKISQAVEVEIKTPFLDKDLLDEAMKIKPEEKISNTQKKIILRKVAVELGLPENLSERPKKAAQYGSGFDNLIEKLAKQGGYATKKDYLASLLPDELEP